MKFATPAKAGLSRGNMTPMIDMTFQLVAFFMVVVNFAEVEQNERIRLPSSELAKPPPEGQREAVLTLQLTREETVLFAGKEIPISEQAGLDELRKSLFRERDFINATPDRSVGDTKVIIRADRDARTGKVQELIMVCQKTGFEKFTLRAKQEQGT